MSAWQIKSYHDFCDPWWLRCALNIERGLFPEGKRKSGRDPGELKGPGKAHSTKRKQPPRAPGLQERRLLLWRDTEPPHLEHSAGQEERAQSPPSTGGGATMGSSPYNTMRRVLPIPFNTEDRSTERKKLPKCINLENDGIRTWTQVCLFQNQWPSVWSATSSYSLVNDCSFQTEERVPTFLS